MRDFPSYWNAPSQLLQLDGGCGVVAAWGILKYFRKRTSAERLTKACRYTKKHGTFMIALAVALTEHGLSVTFYSERDTKMELIERRSLNLAQKLGVKLRGATTLEALLAESGPSNIPIVLFNTDEGNGHISPLLGIERSSLILPYSDDGYMDRKEFIRRWHEPEILRQALMVSAR